MKKIYIFILVLLFLIVSIIFSVRVFNKEDKSYNLLENVFIQKYNFDKQQKQGAGVIKLVVVNLNNRHLTKLPVKIEYYDKDGKYISRDLCDLLDFTKNIIAPTQEKKFEIEVKYPKETEFIKAKVNKE